MQFLIKDFKFNHNVEIEQYILKDECEKILKDWLELAKKLNFSVKNILKVENGVKRKHYMIIGVMLKFYKKKILITLVDE